MADFKDNRERFCADLGISSQDLILALPGFTEKVQIVDKDNKNQEIPNIDGLVTKERRIYLATTFADCLPILLYDSTTGVCGLAHAGWKNTLLSIIDKIVEAMQSEGAQREKMVVGLGPSLGPDHFEVSQDIFSQFSRHPSAQIERGGKFFIDLAQVNKIQLIQAGVPTQNIEISEECTYCLSQKYFSYRRDFYGSKKFPTMLALIGQKK